jgi:aminopeptidase N
MYYKGSNMLHTLRHSLDNDDVFRGILGGLNKTFYHQTVTTAQIENYISQQAGFDYSKVFDQYLRTIQVPRFEYYFKGKDVYFRWTNCVAGFNLPLSLRRGNSQLKIRPATEWQHTKITKNQKALIDTSFIEKMYYVSAVDSTREVDAAPNR